MKKHPYNELARLIKLGYKNSEFTDALIVTHLVTRGYPMSILDIEEVCGGMSKWRLKRAILLARQKKLIWSEPIKTDEPRPKGRPYAWYRPTALGAEQINLLTWKLKNMAPYATVHAWSDFLQYCFSDSTPLPRGTPAYHLGDVS